jgi:hypothetical protein
MPLDIGVGDIVTTKKNHPCGENKFLITRIGADFRMKCMKCGTEVWITRVKLEKNIKKLEKINN